MTNIGDREFGNDIGLSVVKGSDIVSLVKCEIGNAAPDETIKIEAIFALKIPIYKVDVYEDDLLCHIRIGKKHKNIQNETVIRPFGTVGRFHIKFKKKVKDFKILPGRNPKELEKFKEYMDDANKDLVNGTLAQDKVCIVM